MSLQGDTHYVMAHSMATSCPPDFPLFNTPRIEYPLPRPAICFQLQLHTRARPCQTELCLFIKNFLIPFVSSKFGSTK